MIGKTNRAIVLKKNPGYLIETIHVSGIYAQSSVTLHSKYKIKKCIGLKNVKISIVLMRYRNVFRHVQKLFIGM